MVLPFQSLSVVVGGLFLIDAVSQLTIGTAFVLQHSKQNIPVSGSYNYHHEDSFDSLSTIQRKTRSLWQSSSPPPSSPSTRIHGWLEDFFEPKKKTSSSSSSERQLQYPEQYPATYERNDEVPSMLAEVDQSSSCDVTTTRQLMTIVRPLLKQTQLQTRPLQVVYDASKEGWTPYDFHRCVDGLGAAVVVGTYTPSNQQQGTIFVGGYNPKGWSSLGGARPSVASFLFYESASSSTTKIAVDDDIGGRTREIQKLRKVGGGGLACAQDDPSYGISFGPDGLVIGLQPGREKLAQSKLGPYYERGPDNLSSLFDNGSNSGGAAVQLDNLYVLVGVYKDGEEIPYSGGVLDMTSG